MPHLRPLSGGEGHEVARGCTTVQAVNDSVELFKETYDAALDKNTYEIQFCELICASQGHWFTSQRAAVFTQGAAAARMKGRKFDSPPGREVRIALWAMSINSALRACLPALTVILTPGEESWYVQRLNQKALNSSRREGTVLRNLYSFFDRAVHNLRAPGARQT